MPAVVEARDLLCAVPREHAESKLGWLRKVAGFFGITPSQARKIYYGERKGIDADLLASMRNRVGQLQERAAARQERLHELRDRLAELRSDQGGGSADRGGGATAPSGGRSDGAGSSGLREGEPAAAVREASEPR